TTPACVARAAKRDADAVSQARIGAVVRHDDSIHDPPPSCGESAYPRTGRSASATEARYDSGACRRRASALLASTSETMLAQRSTTFAIAHAIAVESPGITSCAVG